MAPNSTGAACSRCGDCSFIEARALDGSESVRNLGPGDDHPTARIGELRRYPRSISFDIAIPKQSSRRYIVEEGVQPLKPR